MKRRQIKEDYREFDVMIGAIYETGGTVPVRGFDHAEWEKSVMESIYYAIQSRHLASNIQVLVKITPKRKSR